MATFIETDDLGGTTTPTDAGELIRDAQYGIDATLSNYIIQNVSISHNRTYDETYSQKGALVSELDYDEAWDGQMTVIGGDGNEDATIPGLSVGMTDFEWNGKKWKIRDIQFQGTYNDKKTYTVSFFRSKNFPSQS